MMDFLRIKGRWGLRAIAFTTLVLLVVLASGGRQLAPSGEGLAPASYFLRLISDPEVKRIQDAAFLVKAKHPEGEKAGTGIAVARGFILTAFHLLGNPNFGKVTAEGIWVSQPHSDLKDEIPAEVVEVLPSLDLAVLKFKPLREIPLPSFGDTAQLRPGEVIYLVGHEFLPGGIGILYPRDGKIIGEMGENFFAIFPPVARGFSGGGVFNQKHELIGIISQNFVTFETFREGGKVYKMVKQGALAVKVDSCPPAVCRFLEP